MAKKLVDSYYQILQEFVFKEDELLDFEDNFEENFINIDLPLTDDEEEYEEGEDEIEDDIEGEDEKITDISEIEEDQKMAKTETKYEKDPDYQYEPSSKKHKHEVVISFQRIKEIIDLWDQHPAWSWATLKAKGHAKEIPNKRTVLRWRKQIRNRTNKLAKYKMINDHVYEELIEARKSFKIVRGSHLRTWALEKLAQINDPQLKLKAGDSWLYRFKTAHNISSRKINRLVSKREVKSEEDILKSAKNFQTEIKSMLPKFDPKLVFNTDQCGFSYEITSSRTLTQKGSKIVFGYAQSPKNLSTHSYTVQYLINLAGEIVGNVFICLQEPNGKLGPKVKKDVESYLPKNVTLTCSTSGKMSTSLNEYYIEKQIVPFVPKNVKKFLHIVDSWSGQTNIDSYDKFFGKRNNKPKIVLKVIPEKCTPLAQPLDTTFHRQLKYLAREILATLEVFVNVHGIDQQENWNTRKGIIRLQSLLHFMLSAPIFKSMIQYAWHSSGLVDQKVEFMNVKQALFTFDVDESLTCEMQECQKIRFINCARCRKIICIKCLWLDNHFNKCEMSPFKK